MLIMLEENDGRADAKIPQQQSVWDNNNVLFACFIGNSICDFHKIHKQLNM